MSRLSNYRLFYKEAPCGVLFLCPLFKPRNKSPVGVSLLAIAIYHSMQVVADTPLSRAGSLLHWSGGVAGDEFQA
jgi:hypothetical protein